MYKINYQDPESFYNKNKEVISLKNIAAKKYKKYYENVSPLATAKYINMLHFSPSIEYLTNVHKMLYGLSYIEAGTVRQSFITPADIKYKNNNMDKTSPSDITKRVKNVLSLLNDEKFEKANIKNQVAVLSMAAAQLYSIQPFYYNNAQVAMMAVCDVAERKGIKVDYSFLLQQDNLEDVLKDAAENNFKNVSETTYKLFRNAMAKNDDRAIGKEILSEKEMAHEINSVVFGEKTHLQLKNLKFRDSTNKVYQITDTAKDSLTNQLNFVVKNENGFFFPRINFKSSLGKIVLDLNNAYKNMEEAKGKIYFKDAAVSTSSRGR